jgi:uncharacterized protein (TIGR01777 family)
MKRILIAGGTGLIGTALLKEASAEGYEVILLSRKPGAGIISWDPAMKTIDLDQPQSFDAILNLAGSNLAKGRWTARRKKEIVSSRIHSVETIREYLQKGLLQTKLYIGASGIGYYRNSGKEAVDEYTLTTFPEDWMVQTVKQWEAAHQSIKTNGIRTIIVRFGIVLSMKGGALKEILNYERLGLLAWFGFGRQIWSWIHIRDVTRMLLFGIEHDNVEGIILAVSPNPVSNKVLTKAIYSQISPFRIMVPAPRFVLRIMLGQMHSVVFDSCRAIPRRLMEYHFTFLFPDIRSAMQDLLKKQK